MDSAAAAAWAAAAIAAWVALAQARSSRQQIRREAVAEVDVRTSEWGIAVGGLLGGMAQFVGGKSNAEQINGELLAALTSATANLNRALRVAEMVCTHKQLREANDTMSQAIGEFMGLINRQGDPRPAADRLKDVLAEAPAIIVKFNHSSAEFTFVGMKLYRLRTWIPRRRVDIPAP